MIKTSLWPVKWYNTASESIIHLSFVFLPVVDMQPLFANNLYSAKSIRILFSSMFQDWSFSRLQPRKTSMWRLYLSVLSTLSATKCLKVWTLIPQSWITHRRNDWRKTRRRKTEDVSVNAGETNCSPLARNSRGYAARKDLQNGHTQLCHDNKHCSIPISVCVWRT